MPSAASAGTYGSAASCTQPHPLCSELDDPYPAFGDTYVGHDEPSILFYSAQPGAGNRMRYRVTLPTDPPPAPITGRSYNFELHPAFWFGMAMCDTQSYPEQRSACTPDSDSNITSLQTHPGTAFQELQFYPPGWVQEFNGPSCDAHHWCAALNIDSLSENPIEGTVLNDDCQSRVLGGVEYVNFAYLTLSGHPQGPPNPLQFDPVASGLPDPAKVLFMNPGDTIDVTLHDTAHGLQTVVHDLTTGQTGSMTASAENGFGQIKFQPSGTDCTVIPYDFHPMYSTSSPATRVPWAAHSYNIAFADEIGHFDWCSAVHAETLTCTGLEGPPGIDQEPTDVDDYFCFPDSASTLVRVSGCESSNAPGFDGASYQPDWPDGNNVLHPTPIQFSSPRTGGGYNLGYEKAAFEADTPRIEREDFGGHCSKLTGAGCTLIPPTDEGQPATFYPFFSITSSPSCHWLIGNDVPGLTTNDFGKVAQFGTLFPQTYLVNGGHGTTQTVYDDFHANLKNPCP
jgi:hypothetical protein